MLETMLQAGRVAQRKLMFSNAQQRNQILAKMAQLLAERQQAILSANQRDVEHANDLPSSLQKRLVLTPAHITRL